MTSNNKYFLVYSLIHDRYKGYTRTEIISLVNSKLLVKKAFNEAGKIHDKIENRDRYEIKYVYTQIFLNQLCKIGEEEIPITPININDI